MTTDLKNLLSSLPARCALNQLQLWREQKEQRNRTSALLYSLGKGVSVLQAKRLDTLKLSYEALTHIRMSASSDEDIKKQLLEKGVRSAALREKLSYSQDVHIDYQPTTSSFTNSLPSGPHT